MIYPIILRSVSKPTGASQVVVHLIVKFTSKHVGVVIDSNDPRYVVGETYTDFYSAENRNKWSRS
jgi:hypothetical protein